MRIATVHFFLMSLSLLPLQSGAEPAGDSYTHTRGCDELIRAEHRNSRVLDLIASMKLDLLKLQWRRAQTDQELGVKWFTEDQIKHHELRVFQGRLYFQGAPLNTSEGSADGRAGIQILALDMTGRLITARHAPADVIHHSSLTSGGPGYFFGEIRATNGQITMLSNMSGHYKPPPRSLRLFVELLTELGLDLSHARVVEIDDLDEDTF